MEKDFSNYLGNYFVIGFISVIIHILISAQYPGGISGMAPFLLIYSLFLSTIFSLIIIWILNLKDKRRFYKGVIILIIINFLILFFYLRANPFSINDKIQRNLSIWYYIALLIPSVFMLIKRPLNNE